MDFGGPKFGLKWNTQTGEMDEWPSETVTKDNRKAWADKEEAPILDSQ
jgi:hypothetical protein